MSLLTYSQHLSVAIDLSYDSTDTIEEYTVEFAVQSYNVTGAGTEG